MLQKVALGEKTAALDAAWTPRIVAALNGQLVKIARFEGDYVWHQHADEDELFLVLAGEVVIALREQPDVVLGPGELLVVPGGVEHRPSSKGGADVLLFEPASTRSTGEVEDARTVEADELTWA